MVSNYQRKTNKGSYSKEKLKEAVRAVKNGMSGYQAAQIYGIPRSTIMDHVYGKRTKSNTLGRNTALTLEEEQSLASSLHYMEKYGFGLTKAETIDSVADFVTLNKIKTPFNNNVPGNTWFSAFKKRQNLSIKKPQAVEYARKKAMNPFIVYPYFDLLQVTLQDLKLLDKPDSIWNMDETSFSKDPEKTKIVGAKGYAATRVISSAGKDNTTVLLGGNALGEKLPPLIIYKGAHMWNGWTSPEDYPGTTYAATKNGWMETEVFENYFNKVFLPAVGDRRPILLIYDGHATHVGLKLIEEARKEKITILKLPPHSSHFLQPLDVSVMKSFKDRWDQTLVKWQRSNIGSKLSKMEFSKLIGDIWAQIDRQILVNGFRKAGIYPFNPKEIEDKLYDSLKLKQWKELQMKQDKIEPKTLLSLALRCIIHHTENNIPTTSFNNEQKPKPNKNDNLLLNKGLEPNIGEALQKNKVQILENRTVTIEELILMKLNIGSQNKIKRTRVGTGAEVLTHDDVFMRKLEEKTKNIKKESGKDKTKKLNIKKELTHTIKKKGKRIAKRTQKIKPQNKKKLARVTSDDSTSVSDVMSLCSDQTDDDISDAGNENNFNEDNIYQTIPEQGNLDKNETEICRSEADLNKVILEKQNVEEYQVDAISPVDVENDQEQGNCGKNQTEFRGSKTDKKYVKEYEVDDTVLVRYFKRNNWKYFIGIVEEVRPVEDQMLYKIRYFKTAKKPLRFVSTKKIDRDDAVPYLAILKIIRLSPNQKNPKEFFLYNANDNIYFL